MSNEESYTIGEAAKAAGISRNSLKTLRMRGHTAMWDAGDDGEDRSWRRYALLDVVLLAAQVEMMADGIGADAAAEMLRDCRASLFRVEHPATPSPADIWFGVIRFDGGERHVIGSLSDILTEIGRQTTSGAPRATLCINASRHVRNVRKALEGM